MYLSPSPHTPPGSVRRAGGGAAGGVGRSSRMTKSRTSYSDDDSNDSDSDSQGSKTSVAGKQDPGMGARLEDEMNNDHLQKLQEIFEVSSITGMSCHLLVKGL